MRGAVWICAAWVIAGSALGQSQELERDSLVAPDATVYREVGGRQLRAFTFTPLTSGRSSTPAILFVQGGAWTRGRPEQLFRAARYFSERGFLSVVIEYRLADRLNSPVESFDDVCHALAFLRRNAERFRLSPTRIAAWGISSSGQVVGAAATVGCGSEAGSQANGGPDALLLVSPVVDAVADGLFRRLMRGHGNPSSLSPAHALRDKVAPIHIAQGEADETTTLERSKAFCERTVSLGARCEMLTFPGVGHVLDSTSRERTLEQQVAFLRAVWP